MEVDVDGPVRPEASVVHDTGAVNDAVVCKENVGPAAPVQVMVNVLPLWVIEVIAMSGTNARVVMA
jgi:hypothetical protein